MANWMIQCADRYLRSLYDYLYNKMYCFHVLQTDETSVKVSKDGHPANSKSYMCVYRTEKDYGDTPIILYEYQKTRKADHPWKLIDNIDGAQSSAIIYSITVKSKGESSKSFPISGIYPDRNEVPSEDMDYRFMEKLLPWSEQLPEICRSKTKTTNV